MPGPATACISRPSMRPHCSSITSPSIILAALALASTAASAVAKSPHSATFVEIPNAAACTTHSQQPQLQSCQPGSATSSVCVGWQPLQHRHKCLFDAPALEPRSRPWRCSWRATNGDGCASGAVTVTDTRRRPDACVIELFALSIAGWSPNVA